MINLIKWIAVLAFLVAVVQCQTETTVCEEMPDDRADPKIRDAVSVILRKRTIGEIILSKIYKRDVPIAATTVCPKVVENIPVPAV